MFFSCLFVLINTVAEWNVWWVERKLELHQVKVWIWLVLAVITTLCCFVFIFCACSAVQMDAAITGLHDGVHCLISLVILAMYYHYYSCTDQIPVADESGLDGLETVRAILGSSFASFENVVKMTHIIIGNIIIMAFALWLRHVGVC